MYQYVMPIVIIYLFLINVTGFIIMGVDKKKAIKQEWRIQEKTMFLIAGFGGSIGVYFGMQNYHHKTKHKQFVYGIPSIFLLQLVMIVATLSRIQ